MLTILKWISLFILFLGFFIYRFITVSEMFKDVKAVNDEDCVNIRGAPGVEDIIKFEGNIIGSSNDNLKMMELNESIPNGGMVMIDTDLNKIISLPIENFPKDVTFHPHGIYLFHDFFIYAINHATEQNRGENVEVLQITKRKDGSLYLNYIKTIELPSFLRGITNDLAVIDDDEFYITTWIPAPTDQKSSLSEIFGLIKFCLNIKQTYIYHCVKNRCDMVEGTSSLVNNGITYDFNDKIYLANTIEKKVRVFQIDKVNKAKLNHIKDIEIGYAPDNVEFDKETGIITAGVIGKLNNHLNLVTQYKKTKKLGIEEMWGGSVAIETRNKYRVSVVAMSKSKLYGISSSLLFGKKVYLSAFADDGVLVCKLP